MARTPEGVSVPMRSMILSSVFTLATLVAVPALAGEKDKASFPMPAATFKAKVDAREARARGHVEEHAAKLPAAEAKDLRAKFDAASTKINAEVAKATADGTVTKEEADAVRKVAKEARPHGRHGKHAKK